MPDELAGNAFSMPPLPGIGGAFKLLQATANMQAEVYKSMLRYQVEAIGFLKRRYEQDIELIDDLDRGGGTERRLRGDERLLRKRRQRVCARGEQARHDRLVRRFRSGQTHTQGCRRRLRGHGGTHCGGVARSASAGSPVHAEEIPVPVFAVGTVTDRVRPWRSVCKLTYLLDTDVDFVLTSGGHNAGIVSEPGHRHRSYRRFEYRLGGPHADPDGWAESAPGVEGSWWPAWTDWLRGHSGRKVEARKPGSKIVPPICTAPATYVLEP